MNFRKSDLKGHIAILAANIIFGINTPLSRGLIPDTISPYTLNFFRMTGALVLFWAVSLFAKKEKVPLKDVLKLFAAGFFGIFINQLPFLVGLSQTSPVDASIIITLLPVYSMILAAVILKEPISFKKVAGIVVGAAGVLLLIFHTAAEAVGSGSLHGNLLIILSGISYAIYLTVFKNLISKYSPITAMKWMFLFAAILAFPFCKDSLLRTNFADLGIFTYFQIAYVVIFATFLSYFLIPIAQKSLRPTLLSMYNYLQPVIASCIAIMIGLDNFGWEKVIAGCLVFAGVYLVTRSKARADIVS
ncbi:MAG: DMT family transporter [Bacteroidales bacterium]|jgi:drug/metabolite transporter (DMT)-like permease|nr:DMT family transporter [Bacteroidales bacterium]